MWAGEKGSIGFDIAYDFIPSEELQFNHMRLIDDILTSLAHAAQQYKLHDECQHFSFIVNLINFISSIKKHERKADTNKNFIIL